ncbi:MAG: hypothetical protein ACNA8W_12025 [Bradymonadaceae bacterium]
MAKIQLLHGPEADEVLDAESVEAFNYQINKAGIGFALGGGLIFLLAAFVTWLLTRLDGALATTGFVILMLIGLGLCSLVSHWMTFVKDSFIATSPQYFFVGRKGRVWRISWSILNKRAMGFHEMELSPLKGFLDLKVAGQNVKVHLFNAFAILDDIQGLMLHILEHLKEHDDDEDLSSPDAPD